MRFALFISTAIHGLLITFVAGVKFDNDQIEENQQISGPEVISLEEYCELSPITCSTPDSSVSIEPIKTVQEDRKSDFKFENTSALDPDLPSSPSFLMEPMMQDSSPKVEMTQFEDEESENEGINEIKSEGNEDKLDTKILSHQKPPPRNSQRITEVASNSSTDKNDLDLKSMSSEFKEDAEVVSKEVEGNMGEESSTEISIEGRSVDAVLNAAPKQATLPPVRPTNIISEKGEQIRSVNYRDLVNDALDQVPKLENESSTNDATRASDNYILYKVEESVRSVYNTAILSGLGDPEKYKVRVKFFVNSKGVSRNSITLLEPRNPSDRHLTSFKEAKNAIIRALENKKNYISREKYPSGINIILNFTPSLGVGYD